MKFKDYIDEIKKGEIFYTDIEHHHCIKFQLNKDYRINIEISPNNIYDIGISVEYREYDGYHHTDKWYHLRVSDEDRKLIRNYVIFMLKSGAIFCDSTIRRKDREGRYEY